MMDSDMIVQRNMDELMDIDLPPDWIAAAHVCACNPRKSAHYPEDWWVLPFVSTFTLQCTNASQDPREFPTHPPPPPRCQSPALTNTPTHPPPPPFSQLGP